MKDFFRTPYASVLGVIGFVFAAQLTQALDWPWWKDAIAFGIAGAFSYVVTDD